MEANARVRPYVLCYDGSGDAAHAIREAAKITGGGSAVVAHAWVRPSSLLLQGRAVPSDHPLAPAASEFDASARETADRTTAEGVEVAQAAGFDSEPATLASGGRVWKALVELADERDAQALVVGLHGSSRARPRFLGGVSQAIVAHARRPVIIVPRPPEADEDTSGSS